MTTIKDLANQALTATKAPSTTRMITPEELEPMARYLGFSLCGDPVLFAMLAEANNFLVDVREKKTPRWLTYCGKAGTGKTHLAQKLLPAAVKLLKRHEFDSIDAVSVTWADVASRLLAGQHEIINDLIAMQVLVIDDIGAEYRKSDFLPAALFRLFDGRLGKWTIITSNLTKRQIAELDVRLASRLLRAGNVIVETNTTDYSLRKERQNTC